MNSDTPPENQPCGVPPSSIFNRAVSLDQAGDDPELLGQLIAVFLEQLPRLLPPLAEAVRRRDAPTIRKTAHALVSSVSVLSAPQARDSARRLELLGLNSDLASVETAHAQVLRDIDLLRQVLTGDRTKAA